MLSGMITSLSETRNVDVCSSLNSWLVKRTLLRWMYTVHTLVTAASARNFFSFTANFWLKSVSSCLVHKKSSRHRHLRHVHDLADTQETLSTTTADSTSRSTNAQARHVTPEAYCARWDHEYGRLAMNSPRARGEHNMAGALTPPATQLTNTSSRQHRAEQIQAHPCFSRHERKATLERVSITRNEKDTPLTSLVGSATPRAGCRTSEKQVQGKDQSPMKEGAVRTGRNRVSHRREQDAVHIPDLEKQQVSAREGFAPMCVLMAPASRSGKFGRCGEVHPLMQ